MISLTAESQEETIQLLMDMYKPKEFKKVGRPLGSKNKRGRHKKRTTVCNLCGKPVKYMSFHKKKYHAPFQGLSMFKDIEVHN